MKKILFLTLTIITLSSLFTCDLAYSQTINVDSINVNPGHGNGIRFWNHDFYKIHMGNGSNYHYGPVTKHSIKMNTSTDPRRGWVWGPAGEVPNAALNSEGNFQINGWMRNMSRVYYFGNTQRLYGNNNGGLNWRSANPNLTYIRFDDKDGTKHGYIVGDSNGENFGLRDGDNNWTYLAKKDTYTAFSIDNNEMMRILANGNVGIGTTSPDNKLDVKGTIRSEEVRVLTGWSDHVFLPEYNLPTLNEEELFIAKNGHLLGFESEKAMNGEVKLADVTNRQQETIEKLMLHVIELNKKIDRLEEKLETDK